MPSFYNSILFFLSYNSKNHPKSHYTGYKAAEYYKYPKGHIHKKSMRYYIYKIVRGGGKHPQVIIKKDMVEDDEIFFKIACNNCRHSTCNNKDSQSAENQ